MKLARSDRGWMSGVTGDGVVTIGDPRLKAETEAIGDVHDLADLLARMVDRLRDLNGAGLAAPQIGTSVKVIVVEVRKTDVFPDRPTSPLPQMINPVIVENPGQPRTAGRVASACPGSWALCHEPRPSPSTSSTPQQRVPMSRSNTLGMWPG